MSRSTSTLTKKNLATGTHDTQSQMKSPVHVTKTESKTKVRMWTLSPHHIKRQFLTWNYTTFKHPQLAGPTPHQ
jgi:hypothetical protein